MKHNFIIISLLLTCIISKAQNETADYQLGGYPIAIEGELNGFSLDWETEELKGGVDVATITLRRDQPGTPPKIALKWNLPSRNVAGQWNTSAFLNKNIRADWYPSKVKSMLAREAPVICLFGYDDTNRLSFSVSDALNTVELTTSVREEDGEIYNQIIFFSEKHRELDYYEVQVRFDTRSINYATSLNEVGDWWAGFDQYTPSFVPNDARLPMYSTWYSYHQNVTRKELVEESKLARKMGFKSIIVDDGWQTLDNKRGYAYTGDWLPERIPDMKEFVQDVHDLGMKFLLWYSVPLVGEKSQAYEKMKGKFLRYWNGQGAYELDPRYPEVRAFIINTYIKAAQEWNLDGFKLDFIARFTANQNTKLTAEDGRDIASVNEATDKLMTDLMLQLREIKPDIMVEFRQPYSGPAMRKYGNIFRAADCPNLAMVNRVRTTDLRMISGNTAVHADMLMWHYDESVEVAALQLANVIFSVPQISVRLADVPEDHFKMVRFYTDYWTKNRSVLLDKAITAKNPLGNYPVISSSNGEKRIIALYEDQFVEMNSAQEKQVDIINGKKSNKVIIDHMGAARKYKLTIYDCMGEKLQQGTTQLSQGVQSFSVPVAGILSLERME